MSERTNDPEAEYLPMLTEAVSETTSSVRQSLTSDPLTAILLLFALIVLSMGGGVVGFGIWVVLAVSWVLLSPILTALIGQFAIFVFFQNGQLLFIILAEGLLLAQIVLEKSWSLAGRLVFLGVTALLLTLGVGLYRLSGILTAILGLLLIFGTASYFLHRYLLLNLGLLTDGAGTSTNE